MKRYVSIAILAIFVFGLVYQSSALASEKVTDEVRAAVDEFYSALNVMFTGDVGPMQEIWSHADDVTYMGPGGGFLVGWNRVLPEWKRQASLKLGGKVEPEEIQITVGRDLAIVSNYEIGENTVDGERQEVMIRATNLLRYENGKWKMIGHHTDTLPYLQK